MALDVTRAVERNSYWSRRLRWDRHADQIGTLFTTSPATPEGFAEAVAQWQYHRRPPLVVDGIIGPDTWEAMRDHLGIGSPASPPTMPASDEAVSADFHSLQVHGHTVRFFDYVRLSGTAQKIHALRPHFLRLPPSHIRHIYPIFLVRRAPWAAGPTGGGMTWPPGRAGRVFRTARHERNSRVPPAAVHQLVIRPGRGMIAIPAHRWSRAFAARGGPRTVVMHEIGHSIDVELGLVPARRTHPQFPGMKDDGSFCGTPDPLRQQAVEAYARMTYSAQIFHFRPAGRLSDADINRRILETLRRSPAFRTVPASWHP